MVPGPSSPQPSPKKSPKRKILQQQTQSQTNKVPQRMVNVGPKQEPPASFTQHPTKPPHLLLPSSLKSRDGSGGTLGASFVARAANVKERAGGNQNPVGISNTSNVNALGITRSVSELRDLYESQVACRPSSSHSTRSSTRPPSIVCSPALRGQVLGETLSGHGRFHLSELDEVLSLPPPQSASFSTKEITSEASTPSSFQTSPNPSSSNRLSMENVSSFPDGLLTNTSSPNLTALGSSSSVPDETTSDSSSPNLVALGHSSSQDFNPEPHDPSLIVAPLYLSSSSSRATQSEQFFNPHSRSAATSSSPNVGTLGSSSPNYDTIRYDDSSDASPDSLRTIRKSRSEIVHEQTSTAAFSTRSEQFHSSPPDHRRSAKSALNLNFPLASEAQLEAPPLPQASGFRAHEELQMSLESSPAPEIQYPVVAAPKINSGEDLNVQKRARRLPQEDISRARWNPHLSTVPSEWSEENQLGSFHTLDTEDASDTDSVPEMPQAAYTCNRSANNSTSVLGILPEADRREATDVISGLRGPYLRDKNSGFFSMFSGSSPSNSIRSIVLRRSNSSVSLNSTVRFPAWARRYYSRGTGGPSHSLQPATFRSNLSQASCPSGPSAGLVPPTEQSSYSLFLPRTRDGKNPRERHVLPGIGPLVSNPSQQRLSSLPLDPADPRAHWAGSEQAALEAELRNRPPAESRLANELSPHLFPDNRASGRNRWLAPSIEENGASIITWRNAHMLGFMLGFILPISWLGAALLPLPTKPIMKENMHDPESGGPTLQEQLDHQTATRDRIRYANLRWWRNLNRFMAIVGLVVIAIIVSQGESTKAGGDGTLTGR